MRYLVLLLLFSCSTSAPLKYKYTSSKRYLASLTREDVVVAKIEGEVKNPVLFASGMESTWLTVKLFDEEGNVLTDVDPQDLTLSSNVDIEAKPFVRKHGVYKAEILPRVKSKNVRMRVDWQEKVMSNEIILRTTIAPVKDKLELKKNVSYQSVNLNYGRNSNDPTDGFEMANNGDNRIVDSAKNPERQREFAFLYPEQARQNLSMWFRDYVSDRDSESLHSIFMMFPRKQLFLVEELSGTIDVTLPTGEKMIFNKETKEIVDGVFVEGPMASIKVDKRKRHYIDLKYQGKGVVLRANARGQMPQLGQWETNKIDMEYGNTGSVDILIINGSTGQRCRRPKEDFWEQIDVSPIEFKFPTDEEFDDYLKKNCGFGLPKL